MQQQGPYGPPSRGPSTTVVVTAILVGAVVLVVAVAGLAWIAVERLSSSADPAATGTTARAEEPTGGSSDEPAPEEPAPADGGDEAAYGAAPPAAVERLQQRWDDGDDTYLFELDGMPGSFRGPRHWGCAKMSDTQWNCIDDGGTFPVEPKHDPGTTGLLETMACDEPCRIDTSDRLRRVGGRFVDVVPQLDRLDERTWWLDAPGAEGGRTLLLARSTDTDGDDRPDTVVWAFLGASEPDVDAAGMAMRDLWDRLG